MRKSTFTCRKQLLAKSIILAAVSTTSALAGAAALEEIIVTAQKREQTLQEVPASVSAVTGEAIRDYVGSADNIKALAARVPSLQIESSNGRQSPRFYIRGLGNVDFDVNAVQPVSMIMDDIALENSILKSLPLFDVERVEVLKGPQGTLFGRNTPAGIVKIDTVSPSEEFSGYASASYGSRDTVITEFAVGGGLSDTVSSRLSVKYQERDKWIDNTVNGPGDDFGGFDELAYRLQFLIDPSDEFSALIKLHGFHQDGDQPLIFYGNALEQGRKGLRPGFDEEVATQNAASGMTLDHTGGSVKLEYQFDTLKLTSITGYDTAESFSWADIDGGLPVWMEPLSEIGTLGRSGFDVASGDGLDDHHQLTQELRFSGEAESLFYQFGLYYFDEDITVRSTDFFGDPSLDATTYVRQQTESVAIFGQVEKELSNELSVTAGLRYTDDDKELDVIPGANSFAAPATISTGDDYISWDLSLNYAANDDLSFYGRIGTASRGPVTLGRFGFTSQADTETLTSAEVGFKSNLMDGAARWNATIFTYEIDDQQLFASAGNANFMSAINADKTVGSGFETDFEWAVTDNFRLMANMSYNDTEIQDNETTVVRCGSNPSCTPLDPEVKVVPGFFGPEHHVSIDGNPLPRAPKWIYNISLSYTMPLDSGASMYFNTDWNYRDESNILLYEATEFVAEARTIGGLRFGYRNSDETLDVALVGRNITDKVVVEGAIDFLNLTAFVNEPRYWGMEVRYNY